jgi:hypothetical protein
MILVQCAQSQCKVLVSISFVPKHIFLSTAMSGKGPTLKKKPQAKPKKNNATKTPKSSQKGSKSKNAAPVPVVAKTQGSSLDAQTIAIAPRRNTPRGKAIPLSDSAPQNKALTSNGNTGDVPTTSFPASAEPTVTSGISPIVHKGPPAGNRPNADLPTAEPAATSGAQSLVVPAGLSACKLPDVSLKSAESAPTLMVQSLVVPAGAPDGALPNAHLTRVESAVTEVVQSFVVPAGAPDHDLPNIHLIIRKMEKSI